MKHDRNSEEKSAVKVIAHAQRKALESGMYTQTDHQHIWGHVFYARGLCRLQNVLFVFQKLVVFTLFKLYLIVINEKIGLLNAISLTLSFISGVDVISLV